MSCLKCKRQGDQRLYTLSGCRAVCYICSRCYEDKKLSDEDLLSPIASSCGACMPYLAKELARRSCAYCRRFGKAAQTCNCREGHYVCRECVGGSRKAALEFIRTLHMKKIEQPFSGSTPSPAASEPGSKPILRTRPPRTRKYEVKSAPIPSKAVELPKKSRGVLAVSIDDPVVKLPPRACPPIGDVSATQSDSGMPFVGQIHAQQ